MQYNIHPIFVHFPIALLAVYSVIKALPFGKWAPSVSWRHIERALLFVGIAGAFVALATGDMAEELVRVDKSIVEAHSLFAGIATWIYGVLLLGEIAAMLRGKITVAAYVEKLLCNRALAIVLASAGLVALVITGLLGGAMVYGASADPIAPLILRLFGLSAA